MGLSVQILEMLPLQRVALKREQMEAHTQMFLAYPEARRAGVTVSPRSEDVSPLQRY